jgi:hypothetical protein
MTNSNQMHPAIGTLCREGRTVHYAYVAGVYREGDVEHLTHLLEDRRSELGVVILKAGDEGVVKVDDSGTDDEMHRAYEMPRMWADQNAPGIIHLEDDYLLVLQRISSNHYACRHSSVRLTILETSDAVLDASGSWTATSAALHLEPCVNVKQQEEDRYHEARREAEAARMLASQTVVSIETVAALGKVRIEFADGKHAYLSVGQVGAALRAFAESKK